MITSRQVRAARALLGWTQEMLADEALVALTALKRLESENELPVREDTRHQVAKALEAAGRAAGEQCSGRIAKVTRRHARRIILSSSWRHSEHGMITSLHYGVCSVNRRVQEAIVADGTRRWR